MNIKEACKDKGALPDLSNMYCLIVDHKEKGLSPCWYEADTDHFLRHVHGKEAIREDWEVFSEVKEIRPEKEGELWEDGEGFKYFSYLRWGKGGNVEDQEELTMIAEGGQHYLPNMAHGKNGWKRLSPKVEDESVERVEVKYKGYRCGNEMCIELCDHSLAEAVDAIIGTSGRLTLEYPKETP